MDTRRWVGWAAILFSLGGSVLSPPQAEATLSFARLSIHELTGRSDVVVHGNVQFITSYREGDRIFTTIEIAVQEVLKGEPAVETVALRMYGGSYAGVHSRILGAPCFSEGEELVAFLGALGPDVYGLVNLAEGKFEVVYDGDGTARVRRDLSETAYVDESRPEGAPSTLEDLKNTVRAASHEAIR